MDLTRVCRCGPVLFPKVKPGWFCAVEYAKVHMLRLNMLRSLPTWNSYLLWHVLGKEYIDLNVKVSSFLQIQLLLR